MDLRIEKKELIIARYKEYLQQRGYTERTRQEYEINVRYYIRYLETEEVEDIKQTDKETMRRYQQHLYSGTKLSLSSQAKYLISLKDFYRYLERAEEIIYNPSTIIELPKAVNRIPRNIISIKQINKLFNTIELDTNEGIRDRAMLELFYSSGIRASELLNIKIYDLDIGNNQVMIRSGKGEKDRVVPVGEIAVKYVEEYLRQLSAKTGEITGGEYLFLSYRGKKLHRTDISRIFRKYREKAGITSQVTAHTLRHACATHMLRKGASIRYIQELLGHASIDTTKIYTRVEIKDLKRVHRKYHPREI